ncbi:hypothetical protein GCM10009676_42770 [Prauserella halophila]|uniref:Redox-sensing transcriptional repressor Rex n=1 Tax=Prauserella halophila TaxID=185641 RepID=A0ABN1WM70_9PSEU|nr:NADH/NAD ratio-sensing transcriptional regulator Rex [Prauserella halophila]
MAQRGRRNIASSVRGLARSRRAGKSAPKTDPKSESAADDSASGDAAFGSAEPGGVASGGAVVDVTVPGSGVSSGADDTAEGDTAEDGAAEKDDTAGAVIDGTPSNATSSNTAPSPAKSSNAKTANAKSTGKTAAKDHDATGKSDATGKAASSKAAADKAAADKSAATRAASGKTASGKATNGTQGKPANGKPAQSKAANGKAAQGKPANGKPANGTAAAEFDDSTPTAELPAVADGEAPAKAIPEAAVGRMAVYLRVLSSMQEQGSTRVSSEELSTAAGVNSAKLRKDLSYIGSYGTRGVGYEVEVLIGQIERTLGLNKQQRVAVAGIGNLGHALANYGGFPGRGFPVEALFDIDPDLIGVPVGGLPVSHLDDIPEVCAEREISIGVIATPPTAAQTVCDRLVAGGVQCILNFAPVVLQVPEHIEVRKVDLAVELQILSFHVARRADGQVNGQAAGAEATDASGAVVPS